MFPTYWNGFEVVNGDTFFEWKRCEGKIDLLPSQSLSCSSDPPKKMKVESAGTPFPKLDWCLVSFHHVGIQFFAIRPPWMPRKLIDFGFSKFFCMKILGCLFSCMFLFWISLWSTKVSGWTGGISAYLKGLAGRFCWHNDLYETNWLLKWGESPSAFGMWHFL